MKKTKAKKLLLFCMLIIGCCSRHVAAQLTLTTQVRPRTEYRNGFGTLKPKINNAAFFTSQRSRLTLNYKTNRVIMQVAAQDVRVWGQDASTISNSDGSKLSLHEAWGEIILANKNIEYISTLKFRKAIFQFDGRST